MKSSTPSKTNTKEKKIPYRGRRVFQNSELEREREETGKTETQRPRLERPHTEPKEFQNSSIPIEQNSRTPYPRKTNFFAFCSINRPRNTADLG